MQLYHLILLYLKWNDQFKNKFTHVSLSRWLGPIDTYVEITFPHSCWAILPIYRMDGIFGDSEFGKRICLGYVGEKVATCTHWHTFHFVKWQHAQWRETKDKVGLQENFMKNFEKRVVEIERQYTDALALYNLVRSQRNKFASFVTVSPLLLLVRGLLFKHNLANKMDRNCSLMLWLKPFCHLLYHQNIIRSYTCCAQSSKTLLINKIKPSYASLFSVH